MNPDEQSLLYAWVLWDHMFSTDCSDLIEKHCFSIPRKAPDSWNYVLDSGWEDHLELNRLKCILSTLALENPVGEPAYISLGTSDSPIIVKRDPIPSSDEIAKLAKQVRAYLYKTLIHLEIIGEKSLIISHLLATMQWAMSKVSFHSGLPEISLYTLASTVSAVENCIMHATDEQNPLCLVGLDLSGIQKYIFAVRQSTASGVGKRLRARSFALSVFMDTVVLEILERLKLSVSQVMTRSGGQAYILLPNTEDVDYQLKILQEELDTYCLRHFDGVLTLHIAAQAFNINKLYENYTLVHRAVGEKLAERKRHALDQALIKNKTWDVEAFIFNTAGKLTRCESCQRVGQFESICPDCERDTRLGALLPYINQVYISACGNEHIFGRWYLHTSMPDKCDNVIALAFGDEPPHSICRLWWSQKARYVPRSNRQDGSIGGVLDFNLIARESRGRPLLAYIKADIDHLGLLFAFGIQPNPKVANICQIRSLSEALENIFSTYVQRILTERYVDVYTIYSGGDDLLLVAPWHIGLELALTIRSELESRSGRNSNVSLSAAVCYVKPKTPLAVAVDYTEQDLKTAKTHLRVDGRDRDQVTVFGRPLSWNESRHILHDSQMIYNELVKGNLSSNEFYQLMEMGLLYRSYKNTKNTADLKFIPMLRYQLKRWEKKMKENVTHEVANWLKSLSNLNNPTLDILPEILRQSYYMRPEIIDKEGR